MLSHCISRAEQWLCSSDKHARSFAVLDNCCLGLVLHFLARHNTHREGQVSLVIHHPPASFVKWYNDRWLSTKILPKSIIRICITLWKAWWKGAGRVHCIKNGNQEVSVGFRPWGLRVRCVKCWVVKSPLSVWIKLLYIQTILTAQSTFFSWWHHTSPAMVQLELGLLHWSAVFAALYIVNTQHSRLDTVFKDLLTHKLLENPMPSIAPLGGGLNEECHINDVMVQIIKCMWTPALWTAHRCINCNPKHFLPVHLWILPPMRNAGCGLWDSGAVHRHTKYEVWCSQQSLPSLHLSSTPLLLPWTFLLATYTCMPYTLLFHGHWTPCSLPPSPHSYLSLVQSAVPCSPLPASPLMQKFQTDAT